MEEIDFCWRLKKANYKVMFCAGSTVWHVGGGTLPADNPRKDYLNFRNSLSTLVKNQETATGAVSSVFIRLLLDGLAAMLFLSKGKFKNIWAIVRAHWTFFGQFFKHWAKRKENKKRINAIAFQQKAIFNKVGMFNGSIVFQHFIKRVKTFDKLPINR
jgi:GT2 family glycosyltransferase